MNKKCPSCSLSNFSTAESCVRCGFDLQNFETANLETQAVEDKSPHVLRRVVICLAMIIFVLFGFYLSLIGSANRLKYDQKKTIESAINIIEEKGFKKEAFMLTYLTAYRADDNWLNSSVAKENAYAATNFPFEIITIYPDFFKYTHDDTERAAILLHEAQHLKGSDEKLAYSYVWKNRNKLGWTAEMYQTSEIYNKVGEQTREHSPEIFVCPDAEFGDCTR
jgi:hypothetical protein